MSTRATAIPVILALLVAAITPCAIAQTADEPAVAAPQSTATAPAGTGAENTGSSTSTAGGKPAPSDDSPFDYRASEKISEDLSVSFPVDI
jgi:hypothetical protein